MIIAVVVPDGIARVRCQRKYTGTINRARTITVITSEATLSIPFLLYSIIPVTPGSVFRYSS
jgi:hypothetical protein